MHRFNDIHLQTLARESLDAASAILRMVKGDPREPGSVRKFRETLSAMLDGGDRPVRVDIGATVLLARAFKNDELKTVDDLQARLTRLVAELDASLTGESSNKELHVLSEVLLELRDTIRD